VKYPITLTPDNNNNQTTTSIIVTTDITMSKNQGDIKLHDLEKGSSSRDDDEELYLGESSQGEQTFTKLPIWQRITASFKGESRGIERIEEDERNLNEGVLNSASMWFSANMVIAAMALGMLGGSTFYLSFWESVLTIIFFNLLGLLPVAFFSMFGPEFGLRQMVLSRFLVGNIGVRIFAFITAVACIGWGAVNIMVSAQVLNMVNKPHSLPPWAGCLILVLMTIIVSLFGYNVIHFYEKWSWVPNVAVFFVFIARIKISGNFDVGKMQGGEATAAGVLSFGGAIFGFATGWTTYASDYTVFMRKDYPKWKIFWGLCLGLAFPLIFTMIIGAAAITGINKDKIWAQYYNEHQNGGLMFCILAVDSLGGFGQFCAVLLALSTVANNIPNMYTIALCTQAFWSPLAKIPRFIWSLIGNFLVLAICIPGYYHFEDVMENFMNMIGYYLAIYEAMTLSEHFIYRHGFKGYNVEDWNNKSKYPIGIAALIGFLFGVVGTYLGIDQVYGLGPISALINANSSYPGADIGFELAFGFAFIGFNIVRPFELKYIGR